MAVEARDAVVTTPSGGAVTLRVFAGVHDGQDFDDGEVLFIDIIECDDEAAAYITDVLETEATVRDHLPGRVTGCVVRPVRRG